MCVVHLNSLLLLKMCQNCLCMIFRLSSFLFGAQASCNKAHTQSGSIISHDFWLARVHRVQQTQCTVYLMTFTLQWSIESQQQQQQQLDYTFFGVSLSLFLSLGMGERHNRILHSSRIEKLFTWFLFSFFWLLFGSPASDYLNESKTNATRSPHLNHVT